MQYLLEFRRYAHFCNFDELQKWAFAAHMSKANAPEMAYVAVCSKKKLVWVENWRRLFLLLNKCQPQLRRSDTHHAFSIPGKCQNMWLFLFRGGLQSMMSKIKEYNEWQRLGCYNAAQLVCAKPFRWRHLVPAVFFIKETKKIVGFYCQPIASHKIIGWTSQHISFFILLLKHWRK